MNPEIRQKKVDLIRKYLLGFYEQKNTEIIKKVNGLNNFRFIKRMVRMMEVNHLIQPVLSSLVFIRYVPLWDIDDPSQKVMISVKKIEE